MSLGDKTMKNLSIRYRIIIWFSLAMVLATVSTFLLVRIISSSVMQKTIRGYLISAVEANTDELIYHENGQSDDETEQRWQQDQKDIFINYKNGYLQIDEDFLEEMNDVESGLYQEDGTMLYGRNPIARSMESAAFTGSRIYRIDVEDQGYFVYDRKLVGEELDGLWIRGVVPLTQETTQIAEITRSTVLFLPVLIIAAAVSGYFAARGILKPIQEIDKAASEISSGTDLKKRLKIKKGRDEVYQLTVTMNGMLDRLEESFESERRFASDASHELRTPVSVIMAQTELILEKERSKEEYQSAFEVIRRQGRRMQTLVSDMLDYTRLEQCIGDYPMEPLNLSALAETVCTDMKLVVYKGITLQSSIEPDLTVNGNSMLLTRMLQNLIDNAYKYGRPDGHIRVVLEWTGMGDTKDQPQDRMIKSESMKGGGMDRIVSKKEAGIRLSVADDGMGISDENQKLIFKRFFRGDKSRSNKDSKGNGLGLSMVEKIVNMHGAEIVVESVEGIGSKFIILL